MFEKVNRQIEVISLICFLAIGILFAIFTFYPPRYGIFKDIRDNIYGIKREI